MTNVSTYQKYLVADMLTKRLESIGVTPLHIMFSRDYDKRGRVGAEVSTGIDYNDAAGKWMSDKDREAKVNEFLSLYPDATVARENRYGGAPDMKVRGVTNLGIAWEINFRSGVCERVQVGTKRVEQVDLDAYKALPKTFVEEPVYEYRCPDPIMAAGLV